MLNDEYTLYTEEEEELNLDFSFIYFFLFLRWQYINKIPIGVMSGYVSFIFERPIICNTLNYYMF
jgi:hypothetical protein